MLHSYLSRIFKIYSKGDAREESYYSALAKLFNEYASTYGKVNANITVLPKKTEAGNPDFRIWDGTQHITGYCEAKSPEIQNLNQIQENEQLQRYRHTFPNLILTNFFEFRLFRNGELTDKVTIARSFIASKLQTIPPVENEQEFYKLLEKFFSFSIPKVYTAKSLAVELAKRTRFLRDEVITEELKEEKKGKGEILNFYKAFEKYLISRITKAEFADLYSQTITYGLFTARTRAKNGFNRKLAYDNIPQTIGILRDVFRFISLGNLPNQMEWILDDISEVLTVTDVNNILNQYYHEGKGNDPIIHFYETFLSEYDASTREKRGVYYTPESVVSYIVHSLHLILKNQFAKNDGFADDITILDPSAGTLTFLVEASKLALKESIAKYGIGIKESFIKEKILKNFYGFELMMAPYAIGHLKMSFLLEEFGYKLNKDERFKLYLTNTLEMEDLAQSEFPGMSSISEESQIAGKIKKKKPVLVILGNPPYSVSSANKSSFIKKEMELYKQGVQAEKNIQPLSDDYIKFIRFAQWKIDKAGKGVIGMITNNSYLSGLIHRGMRKSLLESFNEIYILNLHGSSRTGETSPDGSKDENVFDIMQGVAIAIFIKAQNKKEPGKIFYQDVFGTRKHKSSYLINNDISKTKWIELKAEKPYYFFVEKDFTYQKTYDRFWSIPLIFPKYSSGVKTHRDHFIVGFTKEELKQKMNVFTGSLSDEIISNTFNLKNTRDWKLQEARKNVNITDLNENIRTYSYRPFDIRYICYDKNLIDKGCDRFDLMKNFFQDNIGIATIRSIFKSVEFSHIFISKLVTDIHYVGGQSYFFPLYLYYDKNKKSKKFPGNYTMLFEPEGEFKTKTSNLSPFLLNSLTKAYKKEPEPFEIFNFIYAILYSNIYREKYSEFLKIDFPKIPFTQNYKLFKTLSEYGKQLVDLHLLKPEVLKNTIIKFQGKGDNKVEKIKYDDNKRKLYINPNQYFESLPEEIWNYQIGSYRVCEKCLKDRKNRILSFNEIQQYCRIATSIHKTLELQKIIDSSYLKIEKNLLPVI